MLLTIHWQSVAWAEAGWVALGAYLLGCFSTGYYLVRFKHKSDIRDLGSGNAGARNVGRLLGWQGFLLTVLGDIGKGALAVWATKHFFPGDGLAVLAALGVVAGHIWPFQLKFHGGKGMATTLGALWFLDFRLVIGIGLSFIVPWMFLRSTVLPGLLGVCLLPLMGWWLGHSPTMNVGLASLAILVLAAHRKNLVKEVSEIVAARHPTADEEHTKL